MSAFIETRTKELMAKDGLSPLAAWNQAYREAEAELDKKLDITLRDIVQETYRGSGR